MIVVTGEPGVSKTRLVEELANEARRLGAAVLWGGRGAHANHLAYGPFAVALEGYVASRPEAERSDLAQRFPPLVHFVPSLGIGDETQAMTHSSPTTSSDTGHRASVDWISPAYSPFFSSWVTCRLHPRASASWSTSPNSPPSGGG